QVGSLLSSAACLFGLVKYVSSYILFSTITRPIAKARAPSVPGFNGIHICAFSAVLLKRGSTTAICIPSWIAFVIFGAKYVGPLLATIGFDPQTSKKSVFSISAY